MHHRLSPAGEHSYTCVLSAETWLVVHIPFVWNALKQAACGLTSLMRTVMRQLNHCRPLALFISSDPSMSRSCLMRAPSNLRWSGP
jgi:hypothetical protein